ncbi:response regulator [Nereida sp.]|uniref:response regulator n=1 Tax=Nereida sp. TaxID=2736090 RepID=UPI003F698045
MVEDDPASQFMMAEFMDALGYSYELAEDWEICLDLLANESNRFALILMDIHMPKFSGIEASARIRDMQEDPPRNLPIYLMSADQNYHSPRAALDLGLTGALPKAVRIAELDNLLGSYL